MIGRVSPEALAKMAEQIAALQRQQTSTDEWNELSPEALAKIADQNTPLRADHAALGRRMFMRGVVLRGTRSMRRWRWFLAECAKALGMAPVGEAALWKYPVGGKGGFGCTLVQPITDSFLALDTWPDHDATYLFICSCKEIVTGPIMEVIYNLGLDYDEITPLMTMQLDPGR